MNTPRYNLSGHFIGFEDRECGEHRTVGDYRAWCHDCTEWCYPSSPCVRCEIVGLRRRDNVPDEYNDSLELSLRAGVDERGPDECWPWTKGVDRDGYGMIGRRVGDHTVNHKAHVVAFEIANGAPAQHNVLHNCNNPPCCNPAHLYDGTHADNRRDCVASGRARSQPVLTAPDVVAMRAQFENRGPTMRELADLAAKFGVSPKTIENAVSGRTWQNATPTDRSYRRTRTNDHTTSVEGAEAVAVRAPNQRARLLAEFLNAGDDGLTDEEAAAAAGLLASCHWKRAGELRQDGHIEFTGDVRPGAAGINRKISRITERGRAALRVGSEAP